MRFTAFNPVNCVILSISPVLFFPMRYHFSPRQSSFPPQDHSFQHNVYPCIQDDACSAGPSTSTNDKSKKPLTHGDKEVQILCVRSHANFQDGSSSMNVFVPQSHYIIYPCLCKGYVPVPDYDFFLNLSSGSGL